MASIFKRRKGGAYYVSWFDHDGRRHERSARTTDKRTAERIGAKLEAEAALRRDGVVDPRHDKYAAAGRRPLSEHRDAYLAHQRHAGHAEKHVAEIERHLRKIAEVTRAESLSELSLDAVEQYLHSRRAAGVSARTINLTRTILVAFAAWCVRTGRLERNPYKCIPRLDEQRDRRKIRRALTDDEVRQLLDVAGEQRTWYLAALHTGLRRSELSKLSWADVDLEAGTLTVRDGKAHRTDVLPLHQELAEALTAEKPAMALPSARVFPSPPSNKTRRRHFEAARIPHVDAGGRVADLHALRTTLGTRLARAGVSPQVAAKVMRHADPRLTMKHYTVLEIQDAAGAVAGLPSVGEPAALAARHTGTEGPLTPPAGPPQNSPQSVHDLARNGATWCDERASAGASATAREPRAIAASCGDVRHLAARCNGEGEGTRTLGLQRDRLAL